MVFKKNFRKQDNTSSMEDDEDMEISLSGNSFKDIIMMQLRRSTLLSNVEFRGGYYTAYTTKGGEVKEVYVQDSREMFSNSVYSLALLLKPKFDSEMGIFFEHFEDKTKVLTNEFLKKTKMDDEVVLGESYYEDVEDKIHLETYRHKKLALYLSLFGEICSLLARLNYLDIGGGVY